MNWTRHFCTLVIAIVIALSPVTATEPLALKSILIRDVPHIEQKPDFCGEACVAMALRKLGIKADQDFVFDQAELSPIEGRGCYTKELTNAVRRTGFDAGPVWYKVRASSAEQQLDRLFKVIHADLTAGHMSVVCMHYDDRPETTEHFRLVVGFDADRDEIIYQEPATADGGSQRMSRQLFLKLWPLKYKSDEWTIVLLRLRPTDKLKGATSTEFTDADYAQHILELKKRLPGDGFHIVLAKPFVVVGDDSADTVERHSTNTVEWAVNRLKQDYFTKDPIHIVDIWLFKDKDSYEHNCVTLFGRKPTTPFGYYSSSDKALVMNISTGGGTLVHEIVHPFMESNFEDCPSWFNEGLASLYEQCRDNNGHIWGSTNWRLNGLKEAIADQRVPAFKTLCGTTTHEFYREDPGTNYAQARYLCYYLQEQGLLVKYYQQFRRDVSTDPTGYKTLQSVLDRQDMEAFKERWEAYTAALSF
ncbi:MAG TPA: C39 family peptidase [Planctomycetaceae bacterium]|nr:C39 family peptidase [Planctomycetaceae bacterium]HRA88691.1 C39 family peptidase [Planctomycetaceae bacterium]